jgi:soluble cytochrome b562
MKLKVLLTTLVALAIGIPSTVRADEDTPLAKNMSAMNKALRTLKRQIADATKKEENIGLIGKIKAGIVEAAKLEPKKTKDIPAAEKAAYLEKYKKQMEELGKTFDGIETALKADKADEAKALFDKLAEQKEKGHKDFGADDE